MKKNLLWPLGLMFALSFLQTSQAGPIRLLLESDADRDAGQEVFSSSFPLFDDLINTGPAGGAGAFSGINIAPGFSIGGFAYDGSRYHAVLESDADRNGGQEVFVSSFDSFDDFINSGPAGGVGAFSGINIAPGFSVAGFTFDGLYRLLLEADDDRDAGQEVFVSSFNSFDDFINSGPAGGAGAFSGINIAPGFSVGGFAFDGLYRLLLEADDDRNAGQEVFLSSFNSFDEFINSGPAGGVGAFSGINIAPGFSVAGLANEFIVGNPDPDPVPVLEPGSTALLLVGVLGLLGAKRRRLTQHFYH